MKRKLTILALFALLAGALNAQVIFDPATYPEDSLRDGMEIVEIDGTKYLKTFLNGWDTHLPMATNNVVAAPGHTSLKFEVKLERGEGSTTELEDLITGVGIMIKFPWEWYQNYPTRPSSNEFRVLEKKDAVPVGDTISALQLFSKNGPAPADPEWAIQNTDTMYLGRVEAVYPGAIIDPLLFPQDSLHSAYVVDTIDGLGYFKVTVDKWNQFYDFSDDIPPAIIPENAGAVMAMAKYKIGEGGEPIENLFTVIETNSKFNEAPATEDFSKYHWEVNGGDTLTFIKIVGKRNGNMTDGNWQPVSGDTIWVGMIMAEWAESVEISSEGDVTMIDVPGDTLRLSATVLPEDNFFKDLIWSTNDSAIAIVDQSGLVTAMGDGLANITATVEDGSGTKGVFSIMISNQVTLIEAISVMGEAGATTIETAGGTLQMLATVLPEEADATAIDWSVSDEALATIDADGLLTAVKNGTVTVSATATDGSEISGTADINITGQNVGIVDQATAELRIFPNPATDVLHIENAGPSHMIEILDVNGKLHMQVQDPDASLSLDISSLKSGLYLVRSHEDARIRTYKLVK